jgi:glycosyltransferase involved in cell wall biosynthesis
MYGGATVCVVVPAYNEVDFIADVIETIPAFVDSTLIVDDHSTDGTWDVIKTLATTNDTVTRALVTDGAGTKAATEDEGTTGTDPTVSPLVGEVVGVRHETNRGRGAAVKTGYQLAMMNGYDVVAVMDGDGQMNPEILGRIVDPVASGEADYAKGNRLVSFEHCRQMPRWRLFGNGLLTVLTNVGCGYWTVRDPQNGYTAIAADALAELSLGDLYEGYGFLNDLLIHLNAHGFRVTDVPMEAKYGEESSGIRYRSFVPVLSWLLLRGFVWRLWVKYVARGNDAPPPEHQAN